MTQQEASDVLRDSINATIGFEKLSRLTGRPAKSLMLVPGGTRRRATCSR
jgi:hypothetical protein